MLFRSYFVYIYFLLMASTGQISDNIESYMRIKALSFNRIEYLVSHLQLKQDNNILLSF